MNKWLSTLTIVVIALVIGFIVLTLHYAKTNGTVEYLKAQKQEEVKKETENKRIEELEREYGKSIAGWRTYVADNYTMIVNWNFIENTGSVVLRWNEYPNEDGYINMPSFRPTYERVKLLSPKEAYILYKIIEAQKGKEKEICKQSITKRDGYDRLTPEDVRKGIDKFLEKQKESKEGYLY